MPRVEGPPERVCPPPASSFPQSYNLPGLALVTLESVRERAPLSHFWVGDLQVVHIEWLQTFVTVVETGSFTEAAERLGVSQPAVSKQIQQLEAHFDVQLKYWKRRDLRLTAAGEEVYRFARHVTLELTRLRDDLHHGPLAMDNTVRVASGPTLLYYYVPHLVESLKTEAPHLRLVTTLVVNQLGLTEAVIEDRADVALHASSVGSSRLPTMPIIVDQMVPVANPRHVFAGMPAVSPQLFARECVHLLNEATESRQMIDDWFRVRGLSLSETVELGSQAEIRAMLLATASVGFVSRIAVAEDLASRRLSEVRLADFEVARPLYASHRPEPTGAVRRVLEVMAASFEAAAASPRGT